MSTNSFFYEALKITRTSTDVTIQCSFDESIFKIQVFPLLKSCSFVPIYYSVLFYLYIFCIFELIDLSAFESLILFAYKYQQQLLNSWHLIWKSEFVNGIFKI